MVVANKHALKSDIDMYKPN